ncbi:Centromere protein V [Teratosphaeria destructans]|uniref:Centromere protein V n=1 Tax=Teratosphaeria destructans TaxID=418781 RepID=A0A9W7SIU8_9PEZI|nr:Centromere protein V [Teratosphaeria destructans]
MKIRVLLAPSIARLPARRVFVPLPDPHCPRPVLASKNLLPQKRALISVLHTSKSPIHSTQTVMSSAAASSAGKTYHGTCHCKAIQFTVVLPEALSPEGPGKVTRCNCSICTRNGYFLVYPTREAVKFLDNSDAKMKQYFMGLKNKAHRFCPECSSSVLIDFQNSDVERQRPYLAAAMFTDFDLETADLKLVDGKNRLQPAYDA